MKSWLGNNQSFWLLQFVVLIFGFTAILGKLISVDSSITVWYRMGIASIALIIYAKIKRKNILLPGLVGLKSFLIGLVVAFHWILFFEAIKQSNISITLMALSSASIFTAFLEPLFFGRKILVYEIVLGLVVITGLYLIYQIDEANNMGLLLGIASAFLASLFTVLNGKMIKKVDSTRISIYELIGGFLAISLYLVLFQEPNTQSFYLKFDEMMYLIILATVCTAFAFVASVEVMKDLSPFTVSISVNLEPVYGIILAFLIFGESEKMSAEFYLGSLIILFAIFSNAWYKNKIKTRLSRAS